jgi:hypothetical protein
MNLKSRLALVVLGVVFETVHYNLFRHGSFDLVCASDLKLRLGVGTIRTSKFL